MKFLAALFLIGLCAASAQAAGTCPSGLPVTGTNCYFVAASGSDANNGTSESTPWAHAPGMPNCASTCSGVTPAAGQGIVFRGGDTWHRQLSSGATSSDSLVGGLWAVPSSGSGGGSTCNYPTSTSTCIYYGVDTTWFNSSICGGTFCRPKFNLDNPIWANSTHQDGSHPGMVTACSYDYYNQNGIQVFHSDIIFDNWEILGKCWTQPPSFGDDMEMDMMNGNANTYNTFINSYVHGWTETYNPQVTCCMDQAAILGSSSSGGHATFDVIANNSFDGSDACPANLAAQTYCIGGPIAYGDCYEFYSNVVRYMANACNPLYANIALHDNLFEHLIESYDGSSHGGIIEGNAPDATASSVYNNMVRHNGMGITFSLIETSGSTNYFFNNTFFDNGNGSNCVQIQNTNTGTTTTVDVTNNTIDSSTSTCTFNLLNQSGQIFNGTINFENNHLIAYSPQTISSVYNCASGMCTVNDVSGDLFQSEATANGQGYTSSNNYQPTSTSGATYHAGGNLSSSCSTYSADSALCNGSTGGETSTAGSGVLGGLLVSSPTARSTTWDAGAWQYPISSSSVTLSPGSQSFGSVNVGSTSSNQTFTLTNNSGSTITSIGVSNTGGNTSDFVNSGSGTCSTSLTNTSSCTIIYNFQPAATGSRSTTLNVSFTGTGSPVQSSLSGTGVASGLVTTGACGVCMLSREVAPHGSRAEQGQE